MCICIKAYIYIHTQHRDTYESRGVYIVSLHISIYDIHISHNLIFFNFAINFLAELYCHIHYFKHNFFSGAFSFSLPYTCGGLKENEVARLLGVALLE